MIADSFGSLLYKTPDLKAETQRVEKEYQAGPPEMAQDEHLEVEEDKEEDIFEGDGEDGGVVAE
jgi:hypothetical protein